jgi:hypothetical protein
MTPRFPDERDRYGPAGIQWCVHDNLNVFNWAALSLTGHLVSLEQEPRALRAVVGVRQFTTRCNRPRPGDPGTTPS